MEIKFETVLIGNGMIRCDDQKRLCILDLIGSATHGRIVAWNPGKLQSKCHRHVVGQFTFCHKIIINKLLFGNIETAIEVLKGLKYMEHEKDGAKKVIDLLTKLKL